MTCVYMFVIQLGWGGEGGEGEGRRGGMHGSVPTLLLYTLTKDIDSSINAPSIDVGSITRDFNCSQTFVLTLKVRIEEKCSNTCEPHSQVPMQVSWE